MARQNKLWSHSYLFSILVRQCDVRWNQIEASTELMYAKLVKIAGFVDQFMKEGHDPMLAVGDGLHLGMSILRPSSD
jgi:hypothetical protein